MKKIVVCFLLICSGLQLVQAQSKKKESLLRHVVLFKFQDKATPADIKKVEDAFRTLPGKISEIKGFEWGINNSPEKINQGLTHCFFLSFHSEKDRDAYLVHPAHKDFVAIIGPFFDKATVLDYWAHK
jgi:hypothetical protein